MRRERLRPALDPEEILGFESWSQIDGSHPHLRNLPNRWVMHDVMVALGRGFGTVTSIADLSCGRDAYIANRIAGYSGVEPILGDMLPGFEYQGPLSQTVPLLPEVDLFVCTGTIEHLDDPESDLRLIRDRCDKLLLGAPLDEWDTEPGEDHLWVWDREAIEKLITDTGFAIRAYVEIDLTPYWYPGKMGAWTCS